MKTDTAWKDILDRLFPQFVAFFMPELYELIDFSVKPKALDKEFKTLFPESNSEERRVDKLVEVKLKNGTLKLVLLHIEIQSVRQESCLSNCNTLILPIVSPMVA